MENELALKVDNVKKRYRLGVIGGGTLQGDIQSWWARVRGKEDPNTKIGTTTDTKKGSFMALDGISFEVKKGERLGIIGGNGAGKSTTLKILSRVTAPTEGTVYINGRISSMLEVGTGFHPELTGRENIYLNGAILGMSKEEVDRKIEDIIDFSECRQFIDTPVKRYSSGMYVKLAFSVAAHLDSEILIMDEVLAVGDMKFQQKCLNKMKEVSENEGRTVLYVSHNMNTIRQLCDRCIVLEKGRIIFDGDVETAIRYYIGNSDRLQTKYRYSKKYHSNAKSDGKFELRELEINEKSEARFEMNEKVRINLKLWSCEKWNNVKLRFEIKYQDDTNAGTMFFNQGISFEKNEEKDCCMIIDTAHFVPGQYRVNIVAYVYDEFGVEQFLDGVYPGFVFEIDDILNEANELIWLHQYWGHIRLHDIRVISNEQC
ncbi:ABC transporter ATP-binding protein [Faecalicatena contorta]|uniref:ABC transporter ATP-binding protein n=1 Tax=Faecalicatena contorta TaxID=39482 RepID=UPI001F1B0153|nr:ABC transporter ATP-binding protein [Faecalicatena contorta]MCF2669406.1 ABC transporter ATP-binding protein [Faecalicatena contorta]